MFGFLRPDGNCRSCGTAHRRYRQIYARQCRAQNKNYGRTSLVFLSYEAIFLHLVAYDSGLLQPPGADDPTCCRTLRPAVPESPLDAKVAEYCASLGLLLGQTKLQDDVRDDKSLLASLGLRLLGRRMRRSTDFLEQHVPGLIDETTKAIGQHLELESETSTLSMADYAEPTAKAFGIVFAGLAELDHRLDRELLMDVGCDIGRAIIAADCAFDWEQDSRKGSYNPLGTPAEVIESLQYSMQAVISAGFRCGELGQSAISGWLLQGVARRIRIQQADLESQRSSESRTITQSRDWTLQPSIPRGKLARAGVCDCDALCAVFELAECCTTGCSGADCACCCCDDFCCNRKPKATRPSESSPPAAASAEQSNIGQLATVTAPLVPSGMVEIAGTQYPAKSLEGYMEAGEIVKVTDETSFGLIVIKHNPGV